MQAFFALTLLVSAALLFVVQPMFAKMVLPRLGGTPAVWNTCMVFYQAALLAGYLYAHFSTRLFGTRRQAALHLAVLALPLLVLPIALGPSQVPPSDANPIPWLLGILAASIGLPFVAVSASAPMLQAWFADTGHPAGKDPYFLYAASNLGSLAALLGYPLLIEPNFALAAQSRVWQGGYSVLVLLTIGCAVLLWRSRGAAGGGPNSRGHRGEAVADENATGPFCERAELPQSPAAARPSVAQRLRWLALSFAPSSLLLGVTAFISTDLAAVPLLWVIPLALYLITFVLVFSRAAWVFRWAMVWLQPFLVAALAAVFHSSAYDKMWLIVLLHLATFFVTAMVCHGELARSRPPAAHLTEFYIWLSMGGVLGGLLNAMVAPLVFSWVAEYPLVMAAACMLRPRWGPARSACPAVVDFLFPVWLLLFMLVVSDPQAPRHRTWSFLGLIVISSVLVPLLLRRRALRNGVVIVIVMLALLVSFTQAAQDHPALRYLWQAFNYAKLKVGVLGIGALVALSCLTRPLRFALSIAVVLLAGHFWLAADTGILHQERSFFGVLRVRHELTDQTHRLLHGSTMHGLQSLKEGKCREPLSYFHHNGPLGRLFDNLIDPEKHRHVGVVGLGTGTIAAYARRGQEFTYFEIDPCVVRISDRPIPGTDGEYYFTYTHDARTLEQAEVKIVLGDARLRLAQQPDGYFDLLVIDAFSSDAIPIHLITREALRLYFEKLAPDGILMVHISNRYLKLAPVVGNLARDAGLVARRCNDEVNDWSERFESDWVAVVRQPERLGPLLGDPDWEQIEPDDTVGVWTDDFSNILTVLTWWRESQLGKWLGLGWQRSGG